MRGSTLIKTVSAVGVATLLTSACLSQSGGGAVGTAGASGDVKGKTVTIWTSVDQPVLDGMKAVLNPLATAQGITVNWSKVENINQLIITKVQANDPPDIALIPQPGVVKDLVTRGKVTPLDSILDMATLKSSMVPGTLDAGSVNGKLYGLLVSMNVKSLVFYPKKAWDAAGYTAPKTLTDKIKASGTAPWCLGIGSDAATGWPATDWFEDLIMRYGGIAQYNDWVTNKVKFDSPLVRQAAAEFQKIAFTDGNVLGGRKSIASNNFGTAGNPMFNAKPGCFMYKQGSFITGFFPKPIQADLDNQVGLFGFPPATATGENPVLGGGDLAALFKDSAAAEAVMKLLSQKDLGVTAAKNATSFLSPHKDFDLANYPGKITKAVAQVGYAATAFGFDGSDQMPGAVGSGSFWKDMTSWISGQKTLDEALKDIDSSWPAS
jgi:alpha-glucoside transport system substrate-binding protein